MKHTVRQTKSTNGTSIHVVEASDSNTLEAQLVFAAGFIYFNKDTYHVPHLLEHLLLGRSSQFRNRDTVERRLQKHGALVNASTDYEHITIHIRSPRSQFFTVFEIVLNMVFGAIIEQEDLDRDREIVLRELYEKFDSLATINLAAILAQVFDGIEPENLSAHEESISDITLKTIHEARRKLIRPENLQVIVVGPVSHKDEKRVIALIDDLPRADGQFDKPKRTDFKPVSREPYLTNGFLDDNNVGAIVAFAGKRTGSTPSARTLRNVVAGLLFDSPAALVPFTLREKGYIYSLEFEVISAGEWDVVVISLTTSLHNLSRALYELFGILKHYTSGNIDKDDFEDFKSYAINVLPTILETVSDLIEFYGTPLLDGRPVLTLEQEIGLLSKVRREELADIASGIFLTSTKYLSISSRAEPEFAKSIFEDLGVIQQKTYQDGDTLDQDITQRLMMAEEVLLEATKSKLPWYVFYAGLFSTVLIAFYVDNLPVKGSSGLVSLFGYADVKAWMYLGIFLPLAVALLLNIFAEKGRLHKHRHNIALGMAAVASLGYWYCVFVYFGDIGLDNRPLVEDISSVVQSAFFAATPVVAVISLFRGKKKQ